MTDDLNLLSRGEGVGRGNMFTYAEGVAELVRSARYRMMPGEGLVARWTGSPSGGRMTERRCEACGTASEVGNRVGRIGYCRRCEELLPRKVVEWLREKARPE